MCSQPAQKVVDAGRRAPLHCSAGFDSFLKGLQLAPLPDERDLLEVSIKVPTQGGQETKTRIALEFFVKQSGV